MSKQSRFYTFTFNNPTVKKDSDTTYTYEEFKTKLDQLYKENKIQFVSFQEEQAPTTGTNHFQGYIEFTQKKRFSEIHNLFNNKSIQLFPIGKLANVSFDKQREYARNYSQKTSKQGVEQIVINQPFELGQFEESIVGNHSWTDVYNSIQEGKTLEEILSMYPEKAVQYRSHIERAIQQTSLTAVNPDRTAEKFKVVFIYGPPATGKSSYTFHLHGVENVYEINRSNYGDPFYTYSGQPVIVLDEFSVQNLNDKMTIQDLLKICDFQPYKPNIRYGQIQARWSTVYIISNQSPHTQFNLLNASPQILNAFKSRINQILYKENIDKPFVDETKLYTGINNRKKIIPNFEVRVIEK